jgi:hypothetical protein
MNSPLYGPLLAAFAVVLVVLALEELAFFAARSKIQRAMITGVAVFILVLVFNLLPGLVF